MKLLLKLLLKGIMLYSFIFLPQFSRSQSWLEMMEDPSKNFYDVKKEFYNYWNKEERKQKLKSFFLKKQNIEKENDGYVSFKRWEHFMEPRVFPSGDRNLLFLTSNEIKNRLATGNTKSRQSSGNWTQIDYNASSDVGRINCIRFHPTNSNILYAGAPTGGLWISQDGGNTWNSNTDNLPAISVSDIAIDNNNPNVMYLGTGDFSTQVYYGIGILKSADGGLTWKTTGLNFSLNQVRYVSRVIINPNNSNMIWAATNNGIYRSLDAGDTWARIFQTSNVRDMELKPNDPSVVYATNATTLYKSTNYGLTFTALTSNLPSTTTVSRVSIAVTPADPDYLYVLYGDKTTNGFKALYRSVNSGTSFTLQSSTPNLLGWNDDGSDTGGQAYYTLSVAASPLNKNEVIVGGVNIWRSTNGGISWNLNCDWTGWSAPYVHADIQDLIYYPNSNTYYAACDGGVYITNNSGTSWQSKSNGMQIGQLYRIGCSYTNSGLISQGWQDNGNRITNSGSWNTITGGDGMETFFDWNNPNNLYFSTQMGDLYFSNNLGNSFNNITSNINEAGNWITPWIQDPQNPQTIYAGFKNVWKSTNQGNSWVKISSFPTVSSIGINALAISKSNNNYLYASDGVYVYRTTNGGNNWTQLMVPSIGSFAITGIAVSDTDPLKLWITRSGYGINEKVYETSDGGNTWKNISFNLPNIPINCIVVQNNPINPIYIGTDVGVYYRDSTLNSWQIFSNGLPNTIIYDLEISYIGNKIRAATYGRGLWESPIYNPSSPLPFVSFSADTLSGCSGLVVHFSDSTKNNPTSWNWSFPGGTPNTSTLQNPVVTYNNPGSYNDVKLVSSNISGTDSVSKTSYIAISNNTPPTILLDNNDSICTGQSVKLISSHGKTFLWHPLNQAGYLLSVNATGVYSVTVTDNFGCTLTSSAVNIYVFPTPTPIITQSNDTLFSSIANGYQWYLNSTLIPGATNSFYKTNGIGGNYSVVTTNIMGCSSTSQLLSVDITEEKNTNMDFAVYPNPITENKTYITFNSFVEGETKILITDILGNEKYKSFANKIKTNETLRIDTNKFSNGIYTITVSNGQTIKSKKLIIYTP